MLYYETIDAATLQLLKELQDVDVFQDLRLAQKKDIAAMKIAAITGRGSKKDFVDLYYLLNEFSIEQILGFYKQKYLDASEFIALKSLSYFDDANEELPLDMLKDISWENVKKRIRTQVIEYTE
jgi:hypothetical protein